MAAQVEQFKKIVKDGLERYPFADELLGKIEEKTKVSKMNLVLGVVGFTIIWLAIGYGSPFLCDIIGFIFPAYLSFKAVESADTRDDTQWLTYWIVYSYFGLLEFFGDYILFWIPFYSLLKCCFLVWLAQYNGAAMIYEKIVRPFLIEREAVIDKVVDRVDNVADKLDDYVIRDKDE